MSHIFGHDLRQPVIRQPDMPFFIDDDILGFEVPIQYLFFMEMLDGC